jgi:flagellar protein FliS
MATPAELTLMLFDGSIRFMTQFIIHVGAKNTAKAHESIVRAQDIFTELLVTLDMNQAISQNLAGLYVFFNEQLMQANLKKDPEPVKQVIELTRDLRNTWAEAMKAAKIEESPKKAVNIDVRLDALPGAGT